MVTNLSRCILFIKCILPGWLSMQPARMVVHASCQDGCLCHTALSRSVTGRQGVKRGLRPFITLFVHFPFPLVVYKLFAHFSYFFSCLSSSKPVYYAICPFSLSSSEPVYICHHFYFSWWGRLYCYLSIFPFRITCLCLNLVIFLHLNIPLTSLQIFLETTDSSLNLKHLITMQCLNYPLGFLSPRI